MDFMSSLVEQRIKESIAKGEFDNLKGKGKPLELEDNSHVPEELRVAYKLLSNAGMIPEEMVVRKEIVSLRDMIRLCRNPDEQAVLKKKLTEKELRFKMLMEARGLRQSPVFQQYETKILKKYKGVE
ncbi:DnaJ family domain-containing protein [Paenibacillus glycanilyticus]|uniref:DnaJ family domain-containing protein n=1 Tax=Paenibacillus glycanilyticus TaxID=126569 RepID=UPI00190FC431|nr:DnaJ family domain-containing protein [Paenibacillus glycanilyticus]